MFETPIQFGLNYAVLRLVCKMYIFYVCYSTKISLFSLFLSSKTLSISYLVH